MAERVLTVEKTGHDTYAVTTNGPGGSLHDHLAPVRGAARLSTSLARAV